MNGDPSVGLYVPPDATTLARLGPAFGACGHLEVVPETLWAPGGGFNAYFAVARDLRDRLGVPIVGHGIGLSAMSSDPERQRRWVERLAATSEALGLAWLTEHSGATTLDGDDLIVPVAVPLTTRSRELLRARLADLRDVAGVGGIENSAVYALLDPPEAEPTFLADALGDEHALLLDLHNLVVLEENTGFRAEDWLARAPLDRVIEVHLAGGRGSEALPVRRPFRLDSHDDRVPERVWALLDGVLDRLPGLRAITLERLEGTVEDADVDGILADLERSRDAARRWTPTATSPPPRPPPVPATADDHAAWDAVFAEVHRARDPAATLAARIGELSGAVRLAAERVLRDPDALRLVALLVAQQRFSRLLRASAELEAAFDADPAGFTARFRAFHHAVRPRGDLRAEAAAFASFSGSP